MSRLAPPWRRVLDLAPTPDLVFPSDLAAASGPGNPEREAGAVHNPDRPRDRHKFDKQAFTKAAAENLVEDDPLGPDSREGSLNHSQAFSLEEARRRRLAHAFSIIVSKVAEDLSGPPLPGEDEWSVSDLMERRLTRRPLHMCRRTREREALVLILDTSGSCLPQAQFYGFLAEAAVKSGDIELYAAPNAGLRSRRTHRGWVPLGSVDWFFRRRVVVFCGDFDGGDRVVEASWSNKVYWFCSEGGRYPSMDLHPWCSYKMSRFRGRYFDCATEDEFIPLWRKVR
ncbi:MAG: hypothetical protein V1816_12535 [Pseudomonadota bacterium]